jgi:RNA polymerase sigma factor (TIGR02999 family)
VLHPTEPPSGTATPLPSRRAELDRVLPELYDELRRIAHAQLEREPSGHTLSTTALVHEAYLRLVDVREVDWQDRAWFLGMAARAMRRILIDYARERSRQKRGGGAIQVPLTDVRDAAADLDTDLIALDRALTRLEQHNERHCRVVEFRCFAGMTIEETAAALRTSVATVKRDWAFCRAWLNRELAE